MAFTVAGMTEAAKKLIGAGNGNRWLSIALQYEDGDGEPDDPAVTDTTLAVTSASGTAAEITTGGGERKTSPDNGATVVESTITATQTDLETTFVFSQAFAGANACSGFGVLDAATGGTLLMWDKWVDAAGDYAPFNIAISDAVTVTVRIIPTDNTRDLDDSGPSSTQVIPDATFENIMRLFFDETYTDDFTDVALGDDDTAATAADAALGNEYTDFGLAKATANRQHSGSGTVDGVAAPAINTARFHNNFTVAYTSPGDGEFKDVEEVGIFDGNDVMLCRFTHAFFLRLVDLQTGAFQQDQYRPIVDFSFTNA